MGGTAGPRLRPPKYFSTSRFVSMTSKSPTMATLALFGASVLAEKPVHVIELHRLDVLVRSDDVAEVRMSLGEECLYDGFFGEPVRLVLDALPPLVAYDILLIRQRRLIHLFEQVPIRSDSSQSASSNWFAGTVSK